MCLSSFHHFIIIAVFLTHPVILESNYTLQLPDVVNSSSLTNVPAQIIILYVWFGFKPGFEFGKCCSPVWSSNSPERLFSVSEHSLPSHSAPLQMWYDARTCSQSEDRHVVNAITEWLCGNKFISKSERGKITTIYCNLQKENNVCLQFLSCVMF